MLEWVIGIIRQLGYAGLLLLSLLEHLFPPIPSELIVPLAGFVAAQGELSLWWVVGVATIGSLAGSGAWYVVARRVGEQRLRAWVGRHGRWLTVTEQDVDRSQQWFRRHGAQAVLLGRLVPGVRTLVSIPAGFGGMAVGPFVAYSALGTAGWTLGLAWAGYLLRANFTAVEAWVGTAANVVFGTFALLLVRRYIRCWRNM